MLLLPSSERDRVGHIRLNHQEIAEENLVREEISITAQKLVPSLIEHLNLFTPRLCAKSAVLDLVRSPRLILKYPKTINLSGLILSLSK